MIELSLQINQIAVQTKQAEETAIMCVLHTKARMNT